MHTDAVTALLEQVAAEVITPRFRDLTDAQVSEKRPGDLVTIADHEAEVVLTRELLAAYPDAVVLGEEAFAADPVLLERFRAADHAFTVDPVDGTKNFVNGSADHAVMVAEIRAGAVIRAWIHQPQYGRTYVAEQGAGAWCGGHRLPVTPPAPPDVRDWRVHTSLRRRVGSTAGDLGPFELSWVCCGVDYPKVATGAAELIWYRNSAPWDHAPGSLLLAEAGGYVGQVDGRDYEVMVESGPLLAASSPQVYQATVQAIATT